MKQGERYAFDRETLRSPYGLQPPLWLHKSKYNPRFSPPPTFVVCNFFLIGAIEEVRPLGHSCGTTLPPPPFLRGIKKAIPLLPGPVEGRRRSYGIFPKNVESRDIRQTWAGNTRFLCVSNRHQGQTETCHHLTHSVAEGR